MILCNLSMECTRPFTWSHFQQLSALLETIYMTYGTQRIQFSRQQYMIELAWTNNNRTFFSSGFFIFYSATNLHEIQTTARSVEGSLVQVPLEFSDGAVWFQRATSSWIRGGGEGRGWAKYCNSTSMAIPWKNSLISPRQGFAQLHLPLHPTKRFTLREHFYTCINHWPLGVSVIIFNLMDL